MMFSARACRVAEGCCVIGALCLGSSGCGGKSSSRRSEAPSAAGASGTSTSAMKPSGAGGSDATGDAAAGATPGTGAASAAGGVGGASGQAGGAAGSEDACAQSEQNLVPCFPSSQVCEDLGTALDEILPGMPWYVLLEASSLGPEAGLVAVAGRAVLANVGTGVWQVIRLEGPADPYVMQSERLFSVWDFPDPALQPIDVVDGRAMNSTTDILALACTAAECRLFGAPEGEAPSAPVLTELSLPPLPSSFEPTGLAVDTGGDPGQERLCAFGNGMTCLVDGAWQTAIPAQPGVEILDVLLSGGSVAIGTGGRWYKRDAYPEWSEQAPLGAQLDYVGLLRQMGTRYDQPVIVGDGRLWRIESSCAIECSLEQRLEAALGRNLVETDGQNLLLVRDPPRWCENRLLDLGGPVLDASYAPECDSDNPRVLTAARVIGQDFCVIAGG